MLITCIVPTPSMNRRPTSSSTGLVSVTIAIVHPSVSGRDWRPPSPRRRHNPCGIVIFSTGSARSHVPVDGILGLIGAEAPGRHRRPEMAGQGRVDLGDGLHGGAH